ncbi:MAG: hypothetical protein EXS31_10035 [Pedosphaera sp.]|nr:hypothetical protein [Pedosphaera sp.]
MKLHQLTQERYARYTGPKVNIDWLGDMVTVPLKFNIADPEYTQKGRRGILRMLDTPGHIKAYYFTFPPFNIY